MLILTLKWTRNILQRPDQFGSEAKQAFQLFFVNFKYFLIKFISQSNFDDPVHILD